MFTILANRLDIIGNSLVYKAGFLDGLMYKLKGLGKLDPDKAAKFLLGLSGWIDSLLTQKKQASLTLEAVDKKQIGIILALILSLIGNIMHKVSDTETKKKLDTMKTKIETVDDRFDQAEKEFDKTFELKDKIIHPMKFLSQNPSCKAKPWTKQKKNSK